MGAAVLSCMHSCGLAWTGLCPINLFSCGLLRQTRAFHCTCIHLALTSPDSFASLLLAINNKALGKTTRQPVIDLNVQSFSIGRI